jgi:hypothetical protein
MMTNPYQFQPPPADSKWITRGSAVLPGESFQLPDKRLTSYIMADPNIWKKWKEGIAREWHYSGKRPDVCLMGRSTKAEFEAAIREVFSGQRMVPMDKSDPHYGKLICDGILVVETRSVDQGMCFGYSKGEA